MNVNEGTAQSIGKQVIDTYRRQACVIWRQRFISPKNPLEDEKHHAGKLMYYTRKKRDLGESQSINFSFAPPRDVPSRMAYVRDIIDLLGEVSRLGIKIPQQQWKEMINIVSSEIKELDSTKRIYFYYTLALQYDGASLEQHASDIQLDISCLHRCDFLMLARTLCACSLFFSHSKLLLLFLERFQAMAKILPLETIISLLTLLSTAVTKKKEWLKLIYSFILNYLPQCTEPEVCAVLKAIAQGPCSLPKELYCSFLEHLVFLAKTPARFTDGPQRKDYRHSRFRGGERGNGLSKEPFCGSPQHSIDLEPIPKARAIFRKEHAISLLRVILTEHHLQEILSTARAYRQYLLFHVLPISLFDKIQVRGGYGRFSNFSTRSHPDHNTRPHTGFVPPSTADAVGRVLLILSDNFSFHRKSNPVHHARSTEREALIYFMQFFKRWLLPMASSRLRAEFISSFASHHSYSTQETI